MVACVRLVLPYALHQRLCERGIYADGHGVHQTRLSDASLVPQQAVSRSFRSYPFGK
jgi:hypothetical protein